MAIGLSNAAALSPSQAHLLARLSQMKFYPNLCHDRGLGFEYLSQVYRHFYLTKEDWRSGCWLHHWLKIRVLLCLFQRGGFRFKLFKRQDMKRQNQKIVLSETRTWGNCESHFYKNEIWWSKIRILGHKRRG